MQRLPERISYLQGLGQGMNIQDSGPQGRMIAEMLAVMADMAGVIGRLEEDIEEIRDYVESLDNGLCQLEDDIYGDEEEEPEYIELRCQNCGEEIYFEADVLENKDKIEVICPNCNEVVFVNDGSFDNHHAVIKEDPNGHKEEHAGHASTSSS